MLDLAANYNEMGDLLREKIQPEFDEYGTTLTKFLVENISLPPAVEEALDKRSSMGIVGNLQQYTQYQAATAIEDAAQNPGAGGIAAGGMGAGLGFAIGNQMAGAMGGAPAQPASAPPAGGPPPLPPQTQYYLAIGGQQAGPFDAAAVQQRIAAGQVTGQTLAWKQGMANWTPVSQVPELASLLSPPGPPPLPPQT
jgi:membrane protease subunit (stomatin/prohibitin family)